MMMLFFHSGAIVAQFHSLIIRTVNVEHPLVAHCMSATLYSFCDLIKQCIHVGSMYRSFLQLFLVVNDTNTNNNTK